ncbi:MAG: hypothetical protein ABJE95_24120 [Byssovorax sp.]
MAKDDDSGTKTPLGRILTKSILSTVNLVVAGSAAVGAAALHSLPILALGGAAYGALIAWDLASPAFWKKARKTDAESLPAASDLTDHALRDVVRNLDAGREKLDKVLAETPGMVKGHLAGVLGSIEEMEAGAARLVKRAEDLTRYLATTDLHAVRVEIESLMARASTARDSVTRKQYESARALREEQLRAVDDIAAARDRVMANLSRMVATLEGLSPKVVRMRALDAQAMDALSGTMNDEIERINGDMKEFEETLQSLGETINA